MTRNAELERITNTSVIHYYRTPSHADCRLDYAHQMNNVLKLVLPQINELKLYDYYVIIYRCASINE